MDILYYILIVIVGIVALFLIVKKIVGYLLKIILVIAVLAVVAFLIYRLIGC